MIVNFIDYFNHLPHGLAVIIAAAMPIIEVRGSVPLGLVIYKMSAVKVILYSIIGGVLPVFPILWFLEYVVDHLRKIRAFDKFFVWLFAHTHAKSGLIKEFELVGLTIFMALPIPGTGIWTGCVAAFLLEIPWIPTFVCAIIATTLATGFMFLVSSGIIAFIR